MHAICLAVTCILLIGIGADTSLRVEVAQQLITMTLRGLFLAPAPAPVYHFIFIVVVAPSLVQLLAKGEIESKPPCDLQSPSLRTESLRYVVH